MERLTWLGHATVLVETGGATILTDPVLRRGVAHLRRALPVPDVPGPLDAILISHLHHDHLDLRSLRLLDRSAQLVVPRGAGRMRALRRLGFPLREVVPGDVLTIGDARVRAVWADHDGRRLPWTGEVQPLGFIVEGRRTVYFAGDTAVFGAMADIAESLDVALLPVWGWGTSLGPGHMDPDEAAQAAALLRPLVAVPIHWGTFLPVGRQRRHGQLLRDRGAVFAERTAERAPHVRVRVLAPGESLSLGDDFARRLSAVVDRDAPRSSHR